MKLPELPTYYYLDHFLEMLSFVETTYSAVLEAEHHAFIRQFRALSADEQCLFVRMTNRRGYVFTPSQFRYAEIKDVSAALAGLRTRGFLREIAEADYAAWLATLKKAVVIDIARAAGCLEFRTSWGKPRLLEHVVTRIPFAAAACRGQAQTFIATANTGPLEFLLYLYFGKTREDLKSFALRDLGIVRVNDAAQFKARFEDPVEAMACFYYARLLDQLAVPAHAVFDAAASALGERADGWRRLCTSPARPRCVGDRAILREEKDYAARDRNVSFVTFARI